MITLTCTWRHLSIYLGKYLVVTLGRGGILETGAESPLGGSQPLCAWHWTLLWQTTFSKHAEPPFFQGLPVSSQNKLLSPCDCPVPLSSTFLGSLPKYNPAGTCDPEWGCGSDRNAIAPAGSGVANPNSSGLAAERGLGGVAGP